MVEDAASQIEAEKFVESVYAECIREFGRMHVVTMEIFFKLFDIWIGLYRLEKCDLVISEIRDSAGASSLDDATNLKLIQATAFTRWKQGKFGEAVALFKQMESLSGGSIALWENIAHTYSSMGRYTEAREYFEKCLNASEGKNHGGILLGLGLLKERSGEGDGLKYCLDALEWYSAKFSKNGNLSSLEGKCAQSIANIFLGRLQLEDALKFAGMAVDNFEKTCGLDSPLLASALRIRADILWAHANAGRETARRDYIRAFEIDAIRDAPDLVGLIELKNAIVDTYTKPRAGEERAPRFDRTEFRPILAIAIDACSNAKKRVAHDGNLGAVFKIMAELGIWAEDFDLAKSLLTDAKIFFETDSSIDCSALYDQCDELVKLIDARIR